MLIIILRPDLLAVITPCPVKPQSTMLLLCLLENQMKVSTKKELKRLVKAKAENNR
jgi:hypothetical protein